MMLKFQQVTFISGDDMDDQLNCFWISRLGGGVLKYMQKQVKSFS